MSELKACPFCGGKPYLTKWGWPTISCQTKGCDISIQKNDEGWLLETVIRKWNTRTPDYQKVVAAARKLSGNVEHTFDCVLNELDTAQCDCGLQETIDALSDIEEK
jgi:hypothetical protein